MTHEKTTLMAFDTKFVITSIGTYMNYTRTKMLK